MCVFRFPTTLMCPPGLSTAMMEFYLGIVSIQVRIGPSMCPFLVNDAKAFATFGREPLYHVGLG